MKKAFLMVLCAGFMSSAFAKDSDWKFCKGEAVLYGDTVNIIVNLYEHRDGDGRATDLTLIYGSNILGGGFNSTESDTGVVMLKNEKSFFRGRATHNYEAGTLVLKGSLSLYGEVTALVSTLSCETLSN